MGAGASVDLNQETLNVKVISELMKSEEARVKLFDHIAEFKVPGDHTSHIKGKIGLVKIVAYFIDPKNTLYPGFVVNVDIINEALKHVLRKKEKKTSHKKTKNSKHIKDENITVNDFHAFFPILLLFQKLYKVFDSVDNIIVPDSRILKGEFMRIRKQLDKIDDLQLIDSDSITEEMWQQAWDEMNTDKNDFISFHEACEYALDHIHTAFNYAHKDVDELEDVPEVVVILGSVKTPVAEVPVAEVPVAEAPVAEVPVAEVPVAEVPVTEVPIPAPSE